MNFIDKLITLLKSLAMGLGFITPGLKAKEINSLLKVDENISNELNAKNKNTLSIILTFVLITIGVLTPVIALWRVLQISLNNYLLLITCLFSGFLSGSIADQAKQLNPKEIKKYHYLILLLALVLFIVMTVLFVIYRLDFNKLFTQIDSKLYAIVFLMGFIASIGLAFPFISGGLLLLSLGLLKPFLDLLNYLRNDVNTFGTFVALIMVLISGIIAGLLVFSPFVKFLSEKHKTTIYFITIGITAASIFASFYNHDMIEYYRYNIKNYEFYVSIFTLFGGAIISFTSTILLRKYKDAIR